MIEINGMQYEWSKLSTKLIDKKTIALIRLAHDKGIEPVYGFKSIPIGIRFNKPEEKIHPKTLDKIKNIPREVFFLVL